MRLPTKRTLTRRLIDLILIIVLLLIAWTVNRQFFRLGMPPGGEEEEEAGRPVAVAPATLDLRPGEWHVGTVRFKEGTYEAVVTDQAGRELFKLKVDPVSGELLAKEREEGEEEEEREGAVPAGTALSPEAIAASVKALLPQLMPGPVTQKGREPFYRAALVYQGQEVTWVRVDSHTGAALAAGPQGPPREKEERGEEARVIAKNLVQPLGWLSVLLAVLVTLYYSWKRSLYEPIRLVQGSAKAAAAAGLRRTLNYHCVLSLVALAIAVVHIWNFWGKLRLDVGWLALAMMGTVALSGVFGKYLARTPAIRRHWRRFHVPYTVLFFVVLALHVLDKLKVI